MIDFGQARTAMVECQLRPSQVTDRRILAAFAAIPRERFVPPAKRALAYSDASLEVFPSIDGAPARFLLAPVVLARLLQLAQIEPNDSVLDVGCMTGYSTAVISRLTRSVLGLETEPELVDALRANLAELGITNAGTAEGELRLGAPTLGPYDAILLNGSVPEIPEALFRQLREGGRLVAVIAGEGAGRPRQGRAYRFVKLDGEASGVSHFDANAKPLPGFAQEPCFTF
jgi:protein-L-isoaspartate(D-aspartate) O-methyltransferase